MTTAQRQAQWTSHHDLTAKTTLYHVSPMANVPSILKHGLVPNGAFVSLSENCSSWWKDGLALFAVDFDGLDLKMHTWLPELDEITVWGRIPAERITLIG